MNMGGIIKDSLRYPFSDWKKILILGFLVLISRIPTNSIPLNLHNAFSYQFFLIYLFINCFIIGYFFKIIQSSLRNTKELPKFRRLVNLFKNGFKVTFVGLIYSIPATLPLILLIYNLIPFYSFEPNYISF